MLNVLKTSRVFKKAGTILIFALPVLCLAFYLWLYFTVDEIFFIGYREISWVWGGVLLIGYVFFIPTILQKKRIKILSVVLIIPVTSFVCFLSGFAILHIPIEYYEAHLGNNRYYLLEIDYVEDSKMVQYLVECKDGSLFCHRVSPFFDLSGAAIWPVEFISDEQSKELHVFIRGDLVYTYGTSPREYEWQDVVNYENFSYDLKRYQQRNKINFVLSKCDSKTMLSCEILPFHLTTVKDEHGNLMLDKNTGEIYILFSGKIFSVYGKEPRDYQTLDWIDTNLLAPLYVTDPIVERYNLVAYQNNVGFEFMLYSCDPKYIDCTVAPFHFNAPTIKSTYLELDGTKRELKVIINGNLIFVYGENPRCVVDDCSQ